MKVYVTPTDCFTVGCLHFGATPILRWVGRSMLQNAFFTADLKNHIISMYRVLTKLFDNCCLLLQ